MVKMLNSGSVAKGTALSTIGDMDLAVYIKATEAPEGDEDLVYWMRDRLREAYSQLKDDQFDPQHHCVTLTFRTPSYADVDVVPVLYEGDPDNVGYLVEKDTGRRVETSVSRHLEFIRARKGASPSDFAQVIRLLKWWAGEQKERDPNLRFKSFMIELICAHLADNGQEFTDYPAAMEAFFAYVVKSGLGERISFEDYYAASDLPTSAGAEIEIFDPVNPLNNVAATYTGQHRDKIVAVATEALEAAADAAYATTKARAVEDWQEILGPSFTG
ncbi:MAG: nucleotidyltransferase [Actinomycetota bacterium]|nr:nucleotidyltransferase [Actinomycetota bacterium]